MAVETLVGIVLIGVIAGWLAGHVVSGGGFGVVGDFAVGILGAFFGSWLLPQLGITIGAGMVGAIVSAMIGAIVLLLLLKLVMRRA